VAAVVQRYAPLVNTWEIWNEPNCQNISADAFAVFTGSTAATIKGLQPASSVRFGVLCGTSSSYAASLFAALNASNSLGLVDTLTYHPYAYNPDSVYGDVAELAAIAGRFSAHLSIAQGENGAPSVGGGYGALAQYNWTECSQAKWFLRRLLADGARALPSNAFTIADICYIGSDGKVDVNHKGLLEVGRVTSPKNARVGFRGLLCVSLLAVLPMSASLRACRRTAQTSPYCERSSRMLLSSALLPCLPAPSFRSRLSTLPMPRASL
jgi:hypothetical protein